MVTHQQMQVKLPVLLHQQSKGLQQEQGLLLREFLIQLLLMVLLRLGLGW
jgi:hypothetical protein